MKCGNTLVLRAMKKNMSNDAIIKTSVLLICEEISKIHPRYVEWKLEIFLVKTQHII